MILLSSTKIVQDGIAVICHISLLTTSLLWLMLENYRQILLFKCNIGISVCLITPLLVTVTRCYGIFQ